ncbi:hypothetical protein CR513_19284, partial [Mucuna pruriens]
MSTLLEKYGVVYRVVLLTIPKPMGRLRCLIEKSSKFCKRWHILIKKIGAGVSLSNRNRALCVLGSEKEPRLRAYENSKIYKEKVKHFHDNMILRKEFKVGQKVLLFNSCLKLIAGKLRPKWDGPFVITNVFPYGAVDIRNEATNKTFKVNGHQLKLFHECPTMMEGDVEDPSLVKPTLPQMQIIAP